ncbi:RAI1 like PD-XK nuclease-domain-containing protein [Auriculariales sp. MPI-PUGE-AT-0066]|nr:RAI1 like PD-XK nuclease-domain-containing protein [Auriculariales sp. MPI-PUGE-AT-0066]
MSISLKRKTRDDDDAGSSEQMNKRQHREPIQAARYSTTPEPEEAGVSRLLLPNIAGPPPAHPPPLQQPSQLLSFSYTQERELVFDNSALRYYVEPPHGADLTYRYEHWNKRPEERGRLDTLLKACLRPEVASERTRANLVTWRGVMTKILAAPYEDRDGWNLNVMSVNDTLYLEEHLTEEKLAAKESLTPRQRLQTYFGYSFESYCTSDVPPHEMSSEDRRYRDKIMGGWGGDVDTNVQWCSVVKTKIGNNVRLILGGEVDCVKDKYTGQPDTFVELKTNQVIRNDADRRFFEKKLLKHYLQSYLLGVQNIVIGFRTPAGALSTVERFQTQQLPRTVRERSNVWDPAVCLKWALDALKFVHTVVAKGSSRGISTPMWRLSFTPGQGLRLSELDQAQIEEVRNGEDRVGFLPKSYYDVVNQSPADMGF